MNEAFCNIVWGGRGLTIEEKCVFIQKKSVIVSLKALVWQNVSTLLSMIVVLETSFYTEQQFKAFRSLEAYNQMVSGFISSVQGHIIADKFVVLAKVRHSQRMNDSLIPIWIITETEGTILSAHCRGCKARLAESCSPVCFSTWKCGRKLMANLHVRKSNAPQAAQTLNTIITIF